MKRIFAALIALLLLAGACTALAEGEENVDPVTGYPVVTFGRWHTNTDMEDSEDGMDPVEWLVLENDGKSVLLLSRYILTQTNFNLRYADASGKVWAKSTLREYLNGEFLRNVFTKEEQKAIRTNQTKNPPGPSTTTKGGSSKEKVFLLSYEEMEKYLPAQESRVAECTEFSQLLMKNAGYDVEVAMHPESWWLRTPGMNVAMALLVDRDGSVDPKGEHSVMPRGVRPAILVDAKKLPAA